jgi:hypothetical protein
VEDVGVKTQYIVVAPDGTMVGDYVSISDIWVSQRDSSGDVLDNLPASYDGDESYSNKYCLIAPNGEVYTSYNEIDEIKPNVYSNGHGSTFHCFKDGKGGFVPLDIEGDRFGGNETHHYSGPKTVAVREYAGHSKYDLGTRSYWLALVMEGTIPVTVRKDNHAFGQYAIDDTIKDTKEASLELLMVKHKLNQPTAEMILKKADAACPYAVTVRRVKEAFSGQMAQDRLSVEFPEKERGWHDTTGMEVERNMEVEQPVDELEATHVPDEEEMYPGLLSPDTDRIGQKKPEPNSHDVQAAAEASQKGQKDFVSTRMLMSLLRELDNEDLIGKYITIFEKACDTLGRLYMQILWRTDAFEERFGKTQLKEFKEMVVGLFQDLGDFICYLRQRDIRPSPVLSLSASDISEP